MMDFLIQSLKIGSILVLSLFFIGCSRPQGEPSAAVTLQAPSAQIFRKNSAMAALPAGKKACYGVNVTGPGIPLSYEGSCGLNLGVAAGFVEEGQNITVLVPKGEARKFSLILSLVETTESCTTLDGAFASSFSKIQKAYIAGSTDGVSLVNDEENVTIAVSFPGEAQTIAASVAAGSCQGLSGLKASLYSNGDVVDVNGSLLASHSSPTNEGLYSTGLGDIFGVGVISSGGVLNLISANAVQFPPEVYSITRKPDSGKYFGLLQDGQIVELIISAGVGSYAAVPAGSCPFAVTDCKVPVWMQSMSAGYGADLYSLDHAGNVYKLLAAGPSATGISVPPAVTQVSFY